jgi:phage replication-related protein YjqB (UPF0714/DUF867 family)
MTVPIPCPDFTPPYQSWQELVGDQVPNPDYNPDLEPEGGPYCEDPGNPCCVTANEEGFDWHFEYTSDPNSVQPMPGQNAPYWIHIAIHGGGMEPPTTQLARYTSELDQQGTSAFYSLVSTDRAADNGDDKRQPLHIAATKYNEPIALDMVAGSDRTVSWHGAPDQATAQPLTYVGGLDTELIRYVSEELEAAGFAVGRDAPEEIGGDDPANIVNKNRISAGVQLEINRSQREQFYRDGDLTDASINDPARRTEAFYRYAEAVSRAMERLRVLPVVPGRITGGGNTLGCAEDYTAAIHWRGGGRTYIPTSFFAGNMTEVHWERRLNETSQAYITVAKPGRDPACCALLGEIHPWCHELTIYRDGQLVWQGPVVMVEETLDAITVTANDVTAWLARLVNTQLLDWSREIPYYPRPPKPGDPEEEPAPPRRDPVPVTLSTIARKLIVWNLMDPTFARPERDWPHMMGPDFSLDWLTIEASRIKTEMMRRVPWVEYVLKILETLVDKGLEYTTVGRRMICRDSLGDQHVPRGVLTPDDLPGGITITRDGLDATTRVWATTQQEGRDGITVTTEIPRALQVCGRLDTLVRNNDRVDTETPEEEDNRHNDLREKRDADLQKISEKWDKAIEAIEKKYNKIIEDCNTKACEKAARDARDREKAVARQKRDRERDQRRRKYETDLKASDDAVRKRNVEVLSRILLAEATAELGGRWTVPMTVTVAEGARLSPTAPVQIQDLVCGEKFEVYSRGFCQQLTKPMRLSGVSVNWGQQGEEVGISLAPLRTPVLEDTTI